MTSVATSPSSLALSRMNWGRHLGLLSPVLFLLLWSVVAAVELFPPEILVSPAAVVAAFVELSQSGELPGHLAATFARLGGGFGAGVIAALVYGCIAALSRTVEEYTAPSFTVIRTVPSIAFIPILILIFGIGETFKILVVAKACFFPVALATMEAVRGIPQRYLDVARAYQLPLVYRVRHMILPATLPSVVTGIRLGLGRSWGVLVAAELVASENGLGQMMEFGRQMFRLDVVMVGVIVTGLVGFGLDRALRDTETRLSRWKAA